MGLLCSRSRSQQRFNMWVNVCRDNICWITGHFVTKFGMVMQHHEPGSCGHFVVVAIFKVKVTARVHMIKIWLFLLYFLYCRFLGNQTWWYIIRSQCHVKKNGLLHSGSRSQQRFTISVNVYPVTSSELQNILTYVKFDLSVFDLGVFTCIFLVKQLVSAQHCH